MYKLKGDEKFQSSRFQKQIFCCRYYFKNFGITYIGDFLVLLGRVYNKPPRDQARSLLPHEAKSFFESLHLLIHSFFVWNFYSFIHNDSTPFTYHVLREESPLYHTLFQIRLQVVTDNKVGMFTVSHSFILSLTHFLT